MTPASFAPGVPSDGIIREAMASISTASSGVKNSNFGGVGDAAAVCACLAAAAIAGNCEVIHAAERPAAVRVRNVRLSSGFEEVQPVSAIPKLYSRAGARSIQNSKRVKMDF